MGGSGSTWSLSLSVGCARAKALGSWSTLSRPDSPTARCHLFNSYFSSPAPAAAHITFPQFPSSDDATRRPIREEPSAAYFLRGR